MAYANFGNDTKMVEFQHCVESQASVLSAITQTK